MAATGMAANLAALNDAISTNAAAPDKTVDKAQDRTQDGSKDGSKPPGVAATWVLPGFAACPRVHAV